MTMQFSEIIRVEMARRQLNNEALSNLSGVSQPTIAAFRKGTVRSFQLEKLEKVAAALNHTVVISLEPQTAPLESI